MATRLKSFWQSLLSPRREVEVTLTTAAERANSTAPLVEIGPADPLVVYFQSAPGAVELDKLNLDSPALRALQAAGVQLVVPLVSQGELIGLINLGPRLSEQEYSTDDRKLL